MAFRIEPANRPEDQVDFTIVTNDNTEHPITIPKPDCLPPETVARVNEVIASTEPTDPAVEALRAQLIALVPDQKPVWDQLVQRQILEVFDYWNKSTQDEDTTVGE